MKLYIVRHGQSTGNKTNTLIGQTDSPLSDIGETQAKCVTNYFENIKIDKVYASDLCRASNTVLGAAKAHGLGVIGVENLREINAGDWEGESFDIIGTKFPEDYETWCNDTENAVCTNGETVSHLKERVVKEIIKIAEENPDKRIVVATHATPVRCILSYVKNKPLQEVKSPANASVTKLNYENGKFTIDYEDECSHLGSLITKLPEKM